MLRAPWVRVRHRTTLAGLVLALGISAPAGALAATAPGAVQVAVSAAHAHFHTQNVRPDFSLVSRRDPRWALVDGTATSRHRLWAAWLHKDGGGKWRLRYFDATAPFEPQSTKEGRVPCDLYPAFGEPRCPPSGPTPPQIRVQMFNQLRPSGTAARIHALLRNNGYSFYFKPLVDGSLVVSWYLVPSDTPANTIPPKSKLVARGRANFLNGRSGKITIRLTAAGKQALGKATRVTLAARGVFTPILHRAVTASRTFTLTR